jgi:hypothetical protein
MMEFCDQLEHKWQKWMEKAKSESKEIIGIQTQGKSYYKHPNNIYLSILFLLKSHYLDHVTEQLCGNFPTCFSHGFCVHEAEGPAALLMKVHLERRIPRHHFGS